MWWTSDGERVLHGAEWNLFREGLGALWDSVEESAVIADNLDTGIRVFDRLESGSQLALLALVGKALSDEAIPSPDLTANTEGAVAAIFEQIAQEVTMEIELWGRPPTSSSFLVR